MSLFTRLLMFYCIFAIGEYAIGIETPAATLLNGGYAGFISSFANAGGVFWIAFGAVAVAGVIAGAGLIGGSSMGSVMPIVLFAPFAVAFLTFITYPSTLFNSTAVPVEIQPLIQFFYTMLNILMVYALISWLKGNE